jgi:hypothetical protein
MPLTPFQKQVARLLAAHRNPESHIAGGAAINRSEDSLRYSDDLDIFHDAAESVAVYSEVDATTLRGAGYSVEWRLRQPGFYRALVTQGDNQVRLDWTTDSAFRFFPVQPDEDFGYSLHPADLATNKVLAVAGREEFRDFLDILYLDVAYVGLGALVWAACGKDPGYTPNLLLDQMNRHARFQESSIKDENLAQPVQLTEMKKQWLATKEKSANLVARLPMDELGCLYLDSNNKPVTPDPDSPQFSQLRRHFGSVRGAWPKLS